jgi:glucose/arabinose dehydrogenase
MLARITFLSLMLISLFSSTGHVSAIEPRPAALAVFDAQHVRFVEMVSGLNQPLLITNASDGSGRLFIIQRLGQILIYKNGALLPTPFLNIQSIVNSSGSEQGLLALAFHPNYESNGRFYTLHTDQNRSIVLSVFTRSSANPDQADPTSRVTVLTIAKLYTNHNGGTLAFGPDGYLYWSTGDGGSGGDPDNNAQNLNSLLGKILRLDVSAASSYSIPASNPFYNNPNASVRKEIWAYGLRNPWRFSFDRLTGDMYVGDVGQSKQEEIDFQPANSHGGENYGWRVMEGSLCYNPSTGCNQSGKVFPVAEYDHTLGCSITGGHVYRGTKYPQMNGYYFYGDFCSGMIYTLHNESPNGWRSVLAADTSYSVSSFGEDELGELYMADYSAGKIYRVIYMLPPAKATLVSPSGAITNIQPTFSWNEVRGTSQSDASTWYYLWINGPSGNVFKQWYQTSSVCSGGICSITPNLTLAGGAHTWWIQTWNDGGYGPWSDGTAFSLPVVNPPIAAALISPTWNITNAQPTYMWNAVLDSAQGEASTWYYLWVSQVNSDGSFTTIHSKWYQSSEVCTGVTCSFMPAVTLSGGNYRWWIQTWNNGGYGPWSGGMNFSLPIPKPPVAATLVSPSGNVTGTTPAYTWNAVLDSAQGDASTWYYLWVSRVNGDGSLTTVHTQWYTAASVCTGATCSFTPAVTLSGGNYRWWIQTWNDAGYGPWTGAMNFTISP